MSKNESVTNEDLKIIVANKQASSSQVSYGSTPHHLNHSYSQGEGK